MSWGGNVNGIENDLEQSRTVDSAEARKSLALELFSVSRLALQRSFASPRLTPKALIGLITRTAERSADGRRFLMHPKRALAAAQALPAR